MLYFKPGKGIANILKQVQDRPKDSPKFLRYPEATIACCHP
jgi:hypothetical protein